MELDDPTTPLLGGTPRRRFHRVAGKLCGLESWKRRLPITIWLPSYSLEFLLRDLIAGVTVGLTSIPQGIAYAIVAGLPPQVGLYSSIFPGVVYMLFGSCKDVTVGPTAILAALLSKYVAQSADFAYLAAFLSGCIILLLGVLQLGFLLDFIYKPVISGFTTAAALQIGAAQLRSLFRTSGSSGDTFIQALVIFFKNIKTVQLWDSVLGVATMIALFLLKRVSANSTTPVSRWRTFATCFCRYVVRARNALVVFTATLVAYILYLRGSKPFALTGNIDGGFPHFAPPPFSTVVNNQTLNFEDMLSVLGPQSFVMPLVAILESIAIAKAFAGGASVDGTQEMIAIGACNVLSSFAQSMPVTGSFTRTALNHASGVVTQAGGFFKACLVLLAVSVLVDAFYFIPRATLAGVIIMAMTSIVDFTLVKPLWKYSKAELCVYTITVLVGACAGLEYGIAAGAASDAVRALTAIARPHMQLHRFKVGNQECISVMLVGSLSYASAEYVPRKIKGGVLSTIHTDGHTNMNRNYNPLVIIVDAKHLRTLDIGVVESIITVIVDLEKEHHKFLMWNFSSEHQKLFEELHPEVHERFVAGPSIDQHVLGLNIERRNNIL